MVLSDPLRTNYLSVVHLGDDKTRERLVVQERVRYKVNHAEPRGLLWRVRSMIASIFFCDIRGLRPGLGASIRMPFR